MRFMPQSSVMSAIVILDRGFWASSFFSDAARAPWSVWTPSPPPFTGPVYHMARFHKILLFNRTSQRRSALFVLLTKQTERSFLSLNTGRASLSILRFKLHRRISHRCLPRNLVNNGFPLLTLLEVLWPTAEVVCPPSCTGTIFAKTTPALPLWRTSLSSHGHRRCLRGHLLLPIPAPAAF